MTTRHRGKLLKWYDVNRRDLPWRHVSDPYAIWVSEIMLQQTRVDTVVPYFLRFIERFPTPHALAEATEDEVMSLWSGLGYYRRARLLHRGAKEVVARFGGEVPADPVDRLSLPGVGRYTAGAIGSIAFGLKEPLVDGNVGRVFARLSSIEEPLGERGVQKRLWQMAAEWVDGPRPGDLNQALMELGATVCTPRNPECLACPLHRECGARQAGRQGELPKRGEKREPRELPLLAVVCTLGEGLWLKKADNGLFAGLWNPLWAEGSISGDEKAQVRALLGDHGLQGRVRASGSAQVDHLLTHRRLRARVWRAVAVRGVESQSLRCFSPEEVSALGISTFGKKLIASAEA